MKCAHFVARGKLLSTKLGWEGSPWGGRERTFLPPAPWSEARDAFSQEMKAVLRRKLHFIDSDKVMLSAIRLIEMYIYRQVEVFWFHPIVLNL